MKTYLRANLDRVQGATMENLAAETGISINTIKSWCSGRRDLSQASYKQLRKIADYFGYVKVDSLFSIENWTLDASADCE